MKVALSLLVLLGLCSCSSRWEGDTPIQMQFRLARERAEPGLTAMPLEGTRVRLYLRDEVLLTNADLKSAKAGMEDSKAVVVLTFTRAGGNKLEDITREYGGQRLAVVLDGVLISAPRIDEIIENGRTLITGEFNQADVEAIARRLTPAAAAAP